MSQGLQVFHADGSVALDTTWRITRVMGSVVTGIVDGFIDVPDLAQGAPWYSLLAADFGNIVPNVEISGTRISWSFFNAGGTAYARSATIVYGTY